MSVEVELLIKQYECDKLYGTIEIRFECGRVVAIKKSETIKPVLPKQSGEGEDKDA
jgi:hypothetical protein